MSLQSSVNEFIGKLPMNYEITAVEFIREFKRKYPLYRFTMDGTIMRRLRACKNSRNSRKVVCINPNRFLYKKVYA